MYPQMPPYASSSSTPSWPRPPSPRRETAFLPGAASSNAVPFRGPLCPYCSAQLASGRARAYCTAAPACRGPGLCQAAFDEPSGGLSRMTAGPTASPGTAMMMMPAAGPTTPMSCASSSTTAMMRMPPPPPQLPTSSSTSLPPVMVTSSSSWFTQAGPSWLPPPVSSACTTLFLAGLPAQIENRAQLMPHVPPDGLVSLRVKYVHGATASHSVAFAEYNSQQAAFQALEWFFQVNLLRAYALAGHEAGAAGMRIDALMHSPHSPMIAAEREGSEYVASRPPTAAPALPRGDEASAGALSASRANANTTRPAVLSASATCQPAGHALQHNSNSGSNSNGNSMTLVRHAREEAPLLPYRSFSEYASHPEYFAATMLRSGRLSVEWATGEPAPHNRRPATTTATATSVTSPLTTGGSTQGGGNERGVAAASFAMMEASGTPGTSGLATSYLREGGEYYPYNNNSNNNYLPSASASSWQGCYSSNNNNVSNGCAAEEEMSGARRQTGRGAGLYDPYAANWQERGQGGEGGPHMARCHSSTDALRRMGSYDEGGTYFAQTARHSWPSRTPPYEAPTPPRTLFLRLSRMLVQRMAAGEEASEGQPIAPHAVGESAEERAQRGGPARASPSSLRPAAGEANSHHHHHHHNNNINSSSMTSSSIMYERGGVDVPPSSAAAQSDVDVDEACALLCEPFLRGHFVGIERVTPFERGPLDKGCFVRFASYDDAVVCLRWLRAHERAGLLLNVDFARQDSFSSHPSAKENSLHGHEARQE